MIEALIGGQILSGLFGANAAKKAAATQAAATREGIAAQERMFERQLGRQEFFRQGGIEAQGLLMNELRRPQQYRPSAGLSAADINRQQFQQTAGLSPGAIGTQQYRATGAGAGAGMDPRAIAADPEGYQRMLAGAREQEARMPGSTFLGQGGGAGGGAGGQGSNTEDTEARERRITRVEDLVALIQRSVEPDVWEPAGGPCTIAPHDGLLVIRAPDFVHRLIEDPVSPRPRAVRKPGE